MGSDNGVDLSGEIAQRVNGALGEGKPITVSYVGSDNRPRMSLRGSAHVHRDDMLALWVRKRDGGLVEAIASNPAIALLYRDSQTRTTYVFAGRARVEPDESVREKVFAAIPQVERDHDPERNGVAVLIQVDEVKGGTVGGEQVAMRRA